MSTTEEKKKMLILKTNDSKEFEVEESVAIQSMTIKNLVNDDCASSVIPLPNVDSEALTKVIDYLKRHASDSKEDDHLNLKTFDKKFVQGLSRDEIFNLFSVANYLDISGLLDITCQKIADTIKDMSVEAVRDYFEIENDFTPEEEDKIRKENLWAFE